APGGWIGRLLEPLGIHTAYSRLGVTLALIFVSVPFVIRTVQPVLADLDPSMEESARTLGAGRLTIIIRVILPNILPAALAGFALAFARSIGEHSSGPFLPAPT